MRRRLAAGAACLAWLIVTASADAQQPDPMEIAPRRDPLGGPFGPPYDPTRPPPQEPKASGPGIVAATLVASGTVEVEEVLEHSPGGSAPLFGVLVDIRLPAGTTTVPLGRESVRAQPKSGDAAPLFAACLPTAENPEMIFRAGEMTSYGWNVALGGRTVTCRGRNAKMLMQIRGDGYFRLTTTPQQAWDGPILLLFEGKGERPQKIVLPGATVELPSPDEKRDPAN